MKLYKALTILNVIFLPVLIFSQKVPYTTFDIKCNNLSASIGNNGILFGTKIGNHAGGIIIADGDESIKDVQLLYKSGFNMAGMRNGTQHGFGNLFDSECYPGPFETGPKNGMSYNKHWNVKGFEILGLIKDFENNGKLDETPPINILKWPAKGNPYFENIEHFKLAYKSLAPFYDRDGDGIYDPYKGDYPVLDASCPTNIPWEMVWCIYHDSGIHFKYGANPISVEIHQMVYGYLDENSAALSNTLFVKLSVTNYGETINDVYCGIFNDFDLGCPLDDYLGCNVQENTAFAYNSIPSDQDSCTSSIGPIANFSTPTPFFSCTSLNKNLDGIMYFSNNPDNFNTNDPDNFQEIYNYLKTKWRLGFPLTYGNTGFNPPSQDTVKFAFPGHPLDTSKWSMKSADLPSADYRSMMNYYIGEFQNGETVNYDLSYTATKTQGENYFEYTDTMITNVNNIKEFFSDCKDSISFHNYCENECVWPGDTDHNGIVNNHDLLNIGIANKVNGLQREVKFDGWAPLSSTAWIENNDENINFKNFDSNGNGIIDHLDTKALYYNFNKRMKHIQIGEDLTL